MDAELWAVIYLAIAGGSLILYPEKYVPSINLVTTIIIAVLWPYIWLYVAARSLDDYIANRKNNDNP